MTKLQPEEEQTIATYSAIAERWAGRHADEDFWSEEFTIFRQALPKGRLLEVGCGGGRDIPMLLKAGYQYVGTDITPAFLEIVRKKFPHLPFSVQSLYTLDFPDGTFDGFWAAAVLLHIPRERIDNALQSLRRVVRMDGCGFISLKEGRGARMDRTDPDHPRFFCYYSLGGFHRLLTKHGFSVIRSSRRQIGDTVWLGYVVRRVQ